MEFEDLTDDDALADARDRKDRIAQLGRALDAGNASLVYAFEKLADIVSEAAGERDLAMVEAALGCIDQLAELGIKSG